VRQCLAASSKRGATTEDVRLVLRDVGFTAEMERSPVRCLSGGWRMKLALARAMLCHADLLLLDEPTNHLDDASVAWLADHLRTLPHVTMVIVSHDYTFLASVITDVIHFESMTLHYYRGGWGTFADANPLVVCGVARGVLEVF
jgi:elongation factor 3